MIKEYFANYFLHTCDVTFDIARATRWRSTSSSAEPWRVTLVDTGEQTQTGGRLQARAALRRRRGRSASPTATASSDVDIGELIAFHREQDALATVTAVQPPGRFGALEIDGDRVRGFQEKPHGDGGWINGGFFVLSPRVGDYIDGDDTVWEREPMERLAARRPARGLHARRASGSRWTRCATRRTSRSCGRTGRAPWKTWP